MLSKKRAKALIEKVVGSPVVTIGNFCSDPGYWEAQSENTDWAYADTLRNGRIRIAVYKDGSLDAREVIL